jgi:inner membrane protein
MLAPTHSLFGLFLTLIILAMFGVQSSLHWSILLASMFGAILPDIDITRSTIGKALFFISRPLERKFGHRSITHSLIGWLIGTILFAVLMVAALWLYAVIAHKQASLLNPLSLRWISGFSLGYFSHLILDMLNPRGVQLLWPDEGRDVIPKNPKFRPESGSKAELGIFIALLFLLVLAFPLSKYGIKSSLRWLLATPASAIQEYYNGASQQTKSMLEFQGMFRDTKTAVSGKADILGVENKRLVVLFKNTVYTVSDELAADIITTKARVIHSDEPLKISRKSFTDQTRDQLFEKINDTALISGTVRCPAWAKLKLTGTPKAGITTANQSLSSIKPVVQTGQNLILHYASKPILESIILDDATTKQQKKDALTLKSLKDKAQKLQWQMQKLQRKQKTGLTPLGERLLHTTTTEKAQDTSAAMLDLQNRLEATQEQINTLKEKMDNQSLLFSGEVVVRE